MSFTHSSIGRSVGRGARRLRGGVRAALLGGLVALGVGTDGRVAHAEGGGEATSAAATPAAAAPGTATPGKVRKRSQRPKLYVVVKSAQDKSKEALRPEARAARAAGLSALMRAELGQHSHVTVLPQVAAAFGLAPYAVDVTLLKLGKVERQGQIEIECELRVSVSDNRGKMLSVMTGGAKIQVSRKTFRPEYEPALRQEVLLNAVKSVHLDLINYLRRRPRLI